MLSRYLSQARASPRTTVAAQLRALVAPHAGYLYSGAVAAAAYAAIPESVHTVVVLGPSHRRYCDHACTLAAQGYQTPLGVVPLNQPFIHQLVRHTPEVVQVDPNAFAFEHSVDVHVPFIQACLPHARLVPLVMGWSNQPLLDQLPELLACAIDDDPNIIVVASSDLSHFHDYEQARSIDEQIVAEYERGDERRLLAHHPDRRGPCGIAPMIVARRYAARVSARLRLTRLAMCNSGDAELGGKDRVVGYAALALTG